MKFDVIVGNPPYLNGLHLQFLNKSFDLLKDDGVCKFIHPSVPFLNNKPTKKSRAEERLLEIVNSNSTTIDLRNGNAIFDTASFFAPLSITTIKRDGRAGNIKVIHNYHPLHVVEEHTQTGGIYIHGNSPLVQGISDKIAAKMNKSFWGEAKSRQDAAWFLRFNTICGHNSNRRGSLFADDFYCAIYRKYEAQPEHYVTPYRVVGKPYVGFKTREEALNAFEYLMTRFVRFCISLHKVNQNLNHGQLSCVPMMDFTRPWSDEQLYEHFELTQEERDFIEDYIKPWYARDFR